jgi:hypothetical protein
MTAAREFDSVRTTTGITSDDGRTIPVGSRGTVLHARPDGTCLAEFAFTPQTASTHGDFTQAVLTQGQYEIIPRCPRKHGRHPEESPLLRIPHPGGVRPGRCRWLA